MLSTQPDGVTLRYIKMSKRVEDDDKDDDGDGDHLLSYPSDSDSDYKVAYESCPPSSLPRSSVGRLSFVREEKKIKINGSPSSSLSNL